MAGVGFEVGLKLGLELGLELGLGYLRPLNDLRV